jgi:hypothetical protein
MCFVLLNFCQLYRAVQTTNTFLKNLSSQLTKIPCLCISRICFRSAYSNRWAKSRAQTWGRHYFRSYSANTTGVFSIATNWIVVAGVYAIYVRGSARFQPVFLCSLPLSSKSIRIGSTKICGLTSILTGNKQKQWESRLQGPTTKLTNKQIMAVEMNLV